MPDIDYSELSETDDLESWRKLHESWQKELRKREDELWLKQVLEIMNGTPNE